MGAQRLGLIAPFELRGCFSACGGGGLGSSDAGLTMFGAGSGLGKNAGSIGASIAALGLRVSESECFPRPKPLGHEGFCGVWELQKSILM